MDATTSIPVVIALGIMQGLKSLDPSDKFARWYHSGAIALGVLIGFLWAHFVQNLSVQDSIMAAGVTYTATQAAWALKEGAGVKIAGDVGTGK